MRPMESFEAALKVAAGSNGLPWSASWAPNSAVASWISRSPYVTVPYLLDLGEFTLQDEEYFGVDLFFFQDDFSRLVGLDPDLVDDALLLGARELAEHF